MMDADLALSTQATCLLNISLGASAMAPDMDWNWVSRAAKTLQNRARQAVPASIPVSTDTLLMTAKRLFRQAWEDGAATGFLPLSGRATA